MLVSGAGHVSVLAQLMVVGSAQRELTNNGSHVGSHAGLTTLSGASAKEMFVATLENKPGPGPALLVAKCHAQRCLFKPKLKIAILLVFPFEIITKNDKYR